MDILAYISFFILILGFIGLFIAALSDDLFKSDAQDKQSRGHLSKSLPNMTSDTFRPVISKK